MKYIAPEMEVVRFEVMDEVNTVDHEPVMSGNWSPWIP